MTALRCPEHPDFDGRAQEWDRGCPGCVAVWWFAHGERPTPDAAARVLDHLVDNMTEGNAELAPTDPVKLGDWIAGH